MVTGRTRGASPGEWAREGTGTWQAMTCRIAFRDVESQAVPCVVLLPAGLPTTSLLTTSLPTLDLAVPRTLCAMRQRGPMRR